MPEATDQGDGRQQTFSLQVQIPDDRPNALQRQDSQLPEASKVEQPYSLDTCLTSSEDTANAKGCVFQVQAEDSLKKICSQTCYFHVPPEWGERPEIVPIDVARNKVFRVLAYQLVRNLEPKMKLVPVLGDLFVFDYLNSHHNDIEDILNDLNLRKKFPLAKFYDLGGDTWEFGDRVEKSFLLRFLNYVHHTASVLEKKELVKVVDVVEGSEIEYIDSGFGHLTFDAWLEQLGVHIPSKVVTSHPASKGAEHDENDNGFNQLKRERQADRARSRRL
jgi:hypothetical protein